MPLTVEEVINRGGSDMEQLGFCHDASIIADGTASPPTLFLYGQGKFGIQRCRKLYLASSA